MAWRRWRAQINKGGVVMLRRLYFYSGDKKKGDKTGDGIGGVWHIVSE
jgi:predicted lipoprotein with Yx(FWY)xxD motif